VCDSWLHEVGGRQRAELWGENWLYEAVFRHRPELFVTISYMKLCEDIDLNCV
jgi:hypothetical protein